MNDDAPVEIVPYDGQWPALFESERAVLERALQPWSVGPIEHVGSTAVVGMCAKPVIDIMAGVESLRASEPGKAVLHELGYQYAAYKTDVMHWFCKPSHSHRTHHLHLIPFTSALYKQRLAFRDLLRSDVDLAARYATLKSQLAQRYRFDRDAYTRAKSPFVARALGLATPD